MHTKSTIRHWMHLVHDEGVKVASMSNHVLHEKSFWSILLILGMLALLFTLIARYGGELQPIRYSTPGTYGVYY